MVMRGRFVTIFVLVSLCVISIQCESEGISNIDVNKDAGAGEDAQRPIRQTSKQKKSNEPLSLLELILVLMAKHGKSQTAAAFSSLDSKPLGEVMRLLIVEVDQTIAEDIVSMQQYAQNSDKQLVGVIAKIVTGDSAVAKDIFSWDDKLRKFGWWVRIRQRMFQNLDKYVANYNKVINDSILAASTDVHESIVKPDTLTTPTDIKS